MAAAPVTCSPAIDREAQPPAADRVAAAGTLQRDRLGDLFDRQHQRLFLLACRMTADREAARDLVQEVFLRAARHAADVPVDAAEGGAWLVRTLVNLCRDHHRRNAVRVRARGTLTADAQRAAGEAAAAKDLESRAVAQATVRAALAQLSPRQRAVVVLHEIEGQPVRAIARLLRVAEVTVRWHLMAARRQLAARLVAPPRGAVLHRHEPEGDLP